MKSVSFLLGSGFSVPDGIKSVGDINEFIAKLNVNDFCIWSDMTFVLLQEDKRGLKSYHLNDHIFFVEFIEWYIEKIDSDFNYEKFYDFFTGFNRKDLNKTEINTFFEEFKCKVVEPLTSIDRVYSFVSRFGDYFNQLISLLLDSIKYYEDTGLGNYANYTCFLNYLEHVLNKDQIINIHTLNHDLLFEHLASKYYELSKFFTDGFSEFGSPYFGELKTNEVIYKKYKVRLKQFENSFNNSLRLFKLHGSVDTFIADISAHNYDPTRIKRDWKIGEIVKEQLDSKKYSYLHQSSYPDILSGSLSKIDRYEEPYYENLRGHFINNLEQSTLLIIIGYGFGDIEINRIIDDHCSKFNIPVVVINPKTIQSSFVTKLNPQCIYKSVSELTLQEWLMIYNPDSTV